MVEAAWTIVAALCGCLFVLLLARSLAEKFPAYDTPLFVGAVGYCGGFLLIRTVALVA